MIAPACALSAHSTEPAPGSARNVDSGTAPRPRAAADMPTSWSIRAQAAGTPSPGDSHDGAVPATWAHPCPAGEYFRYSAELGEGAGLRVHWPYLCTGRTFTDCRSPSSGTYPAAGRPFRRPPAEGRPRPDVRAPRRCWCPMSRRAPGSVDAAGVPGAGARLRPPRPGDRLSRGDGRSRASEPSGRRPAPLLRPRRARWDNPTAG